MSNISLYSHLPRKDQPHLSTGQMTVDEFIGGVKFGTWRDFAQMVRAEPDKERRSQLKKQAPALTISGTFVERKETLLLQHSGFIAIDIDNYTDKSRIIVDPYTYACFDSISATGFAVVVKVDTKRHKDCFRWLQKYYYEQYGITIDPAPQNPASLRYVSYDPTVSANSKSIRAKTLVEPKRRPYVMPIVLTQEKSSRYVQEAVSRGINVAGSYQDYLNLSFALVSGFGEDGRHYFHALCAQDARYTQAHADKQYDIAIKRNGAGISVGTFYYMLNAAGVKIKSDHAPLATAALGKAAGKNKEQVIAAVQAQGMGLHAATALVEQVMNRDDINVKSVSNDPEKLIEALVQWMQDNHPIRRNALTGALDEKGTPITDERMNSIYLRARLAFNSKEINFDLIRRIIESDIYTPTFNPITEYIASNEHRRATGQIDALCHTIESNSIGGDLFLRKWLLGIIACCVGGEPVPYVLALIGRGNTGKTEFFRRLLPRELLKYYAESKLDAGKDDEILMSQKMIIMDDELGGKSKQDERRLKNITSKQIFTLRAPFGRHNKDFHRLALLCGTSNHDDIISDRTGNRRILAIKVESINHAAYNAIDKDELFMELYRAYKAGESWQMTSEELLMLSDMSADYQGINIERELLTTLFLPDSELGLVNELLATEIKDYIESRTVQRIISMKNFGTELKKFFGEGTRKGAGQFYRVIKKGG